MALDGLAVPGTRPAEGVSFCFGPAWARDTGCCGKPEGCTNTGPACLMRNHPWKRRHAQPGPAQAAPEEES